MTTILWHAHTHMPDSRFHSGVKKATATCARSRVGVRITQASPKNVQKVRLANMHARNQK